MQHPAHVPPRDAFACALVDVCIELESHRLHPHHPAAMFAGGGSAGWGVTLGNPHFSGGIMSGPTRWAGAPPPSLGLRNVDPPIAVPSSLGRPNEGLATPYSGTVTSYVDKYVGLPLDVTLVTMRQTMPGDIIFSNPLAPPPAHSSTRRKPVQAGSLPYVNYTNAKLACSDPSAGGASAHAHASIRHAVDVARDLAVGTHGTRPHASLALARARANTDVERFGLLRGCDLVDAAAPLDPAAEWRALGVRNTGTPGDTRDYAAFNRDEFVIGVKGKLTAASIWRDNTVTPLRRADQLPELPSALYAVERKAEAQEIGIPTDSGRPKRVNPMLTVVPPEGEHKLYVVARKRRADTLENFQPRAVLPVDRSDPCLQSRARALLRLARRDEPRRVEGDLVYHIRDVNSKSRPHRVPVYDAAFTYVWTYEPFAAWSRDVYGDELLFYDDEADALCNPTVIGIGRHFNMLGDRNFDRLLFSALQPTAFASAQCAMEANIPQSEIIVNEIGVKLHA